MLKVVVVNNAKPQNPPQAAILCDLQHVPLHLHQKPHFITVKKMQNNKRV
jgi:hypothetical protein